MRRLLLSLAVWTTLLLLCGSALAEDGAWLWLLASPAEPLAEGYVPDNLEPISPDQRGVNLATTKSMLLQQDALAALYRLLRAADQSGVTLYVRQAYRSYADEARRYQLMSATGQDAQKPGESSYQTGLSVTLVGEKWRAEELTSAFADSREAKWLQANAATYGFVLRYPQGKEDVTGWMYEPWHYRYVGVSAAAVMAEQGLCLEELPDDPEQRSLWLAGDGAAVFEEHDEDLPEQEAWTEDDFLVTDDDAFDAEDAWSADEGEDEEPDLPKGPPSGPDEFATGEFGPDGDYEISLFQ